MILSNLLVGIALVLFTVIAVVVSISRTPTSLSGYYGLMYWIIALGGIAGGVYLILTSGII